MCSWYLWVSCMSCNSYKVRSQPIIPVKSHLMRLLLNILLKFSFKGKKLFYTLLQQPGILTCLKNHRECKNVFATLGVF